MPSRKTKQKVKRGRPQKKSGSEDTIKKRKQWREASARYYKKNRKRVLKKAKSKSKPKRRKK